MTTITFENLNQVRTGSGESRIVSKRSQKSSHSRSSHHPFFRFVVLVAGRPMGTIEAKVVPPTDSLPNQADVSYHFFPEARGQAYTQRANNLIGAFLQEHHTKGAVINALGPCTCAEHDAAHPLESRMILFAREL